MASKNRTIDPASSSDDDSSSHSSQRDGSSSSEIEEHSDESESDEGENSSKPFADFEDLPTDDSVEDSEVDEESGLDDHINMDDREDSNESSDENGNLQNEDMTLGERVASRALMGRRYYAEDEERTNLNDDGKRQRAHRRSRAIELASKLLKESRRSKSSSAEKSTDKRAIKSELNESSSSDELSIEQEHQAKRKKSKHAPTEMSSKRRDYFSRKPDLNSSGIGVSIGANRYKPRDPRMVSLSGHLDADLFEKRYDFLDELQEKDIENLKRRVNAWKTTGKKGQKARRKLGITQGVGSLESDQEELKRLLQERAERKRAQVARAAKRTVKRKIRDEVASGKRGAYYPKRNELRRMEMEAKFEEIRKKGGDEAVDKAIAKRRKKNVAKSHKLMPSHMVS
ncbi:hypothetical protein HJC23_007594 [Cyclotella cryptica]|uniref:rRNA biogenesis protein RRP36 n=1 Tax=Cyclotella cryptica TaxID=29204 RepID=A0ABD3QRG0_9STRA